MIMYHGTVEGRYRKMLDVGYIYPPVYVTHNLRLAKAQASRRKGLGRLVVLSVDVSGFEIKKDPLFRAKSDDPIIGRTFYIDEQVPISAITGVETESRRDLWFDTISAPAYDTMIRKEKKKSKRNSSHRSTPSKIKSLR